MGGYFPLYLLGGKIVDVVNTTNADPDSFTKIGAYQCNAWDVTKAPSNSGVLYLPFFREDYWRFELFIGAIEGTIWYRRGTSASWGAWYKFTVTK